ncbi:MAG: thioredoxin family protein [Chitinophagaceae bacterium]|nr:thioredoxin family protein [Chitinophagaceae bacterium]
MRYILITIFLLSLPTFIWCQKLQSRQVLHPTGSLLKIAVDADDLTKNDTLTLRIFSYYYPVNDRISPKYIKASLHKNGRFQFVIPVESNFGYFEIGKIVDDSNTIGSVINYQLLIYGRYWEKDDDITIHLKRVSAGKDYKITFSGKGSLKYIAKAQADSAFNSAELESKSGLDENFTYHDMFKNRVEHAVQILNKYKAKISFSAYNVLKADFLFENSYFRFSRMRECFKKNINNYPTEGKEAIIKLLDQQIVKIEDSADIPDQYLSRSKEYSEFTIRRLQTLLYLKNTNWSDISQDSIYFLIKKNYKGILRDKLISYALLNYETPENFSFIYKEALQITETPYYRNKIKELFYKRAPQTTAFNFTLRDTSGNFHTLTGLRGKIVLLDFWFTGCGGCSHFYKNVLSTIEKQFENDTNVVFISISADQYIPSWKSGIQSGQYTGKESLNLYTNGKGYAHPLIQYYNVQTYPTAILIDQNGNIAKFNTSDLYDSKRLALSISLLLQKNMKTNGIVNKD